MGWWSGMGRRVGKGLGVQAVMRDGAVQECGEWLIQGRWGGSWESGIFICEMG